MVLKMPITLSIIRFVVTVHFTRTNRNIIIYRF